jgi:hypothetical protein
MHVKELNSRDREVLLLKTQLKRSYSVSKAIWQYRDYIEQMKDYLSAGEPIGAKELFEELDFNIQKLLMTAPTKGGAFTTQERATMRTLWEITVEDIE